MGEKDWKFGILLTLIRQMEVKTTAPMDGSVKFTITLKTANGEKPNSFFFRVKMK